MEKGTTKGAQNTKDVPEMITNTAPRILMIVTDKDSLDADKEAKLRTMLVTNYNAVVEIAQSSADIDNGNWDLARYDLIIVCNGVTPTDVNNLKSVEVPVLSLDEDVSVTALNMASTGGNSASETQTNVTDITHQITSEALRDIDPTSIATGNKTVYTTASGVDYITTLGTGGNSLSEDTVTGGEEHTVVYDEGAVLQDATLAEEIRIHFGLYQYNRLNSTGRELLKHAINYAIYGPMMSPLVSIETDIEAIITNQSYNQNFGVRVGGFLPQGQELGDAFYVSKTGVDTNDGKSWTNSCLTIDYCVGLTSTNDYIFVSNGDFDEDANTGGVLVDVGIHIIALGSNFCRVVNSHASAASCFTLTVGTSEITSFTINETTTTCEGIVASVSFCFIYDNVFDGAMENAIRINSNDIIVMDNKIIGSTNDGIECITNATDCIISGNKIYNVTDIAISLTGDGADGNFVLNNVINKCGTGISILLGDYNMVSGGFIGGCTTVMIDTGTGNVWDIDFDEIIGSFSRTVADGTGEDTGDIDDIDLPASGLYYVTLEVAALDVAGEGGNIDMFLYKKVNPASYQEVDTDRFAQGTDRCHMTTKATYKGGSNMLRASHTCSIVVTANRLMYFAIEHA